jgi:hypothetical protein
MACLYKRSAAFALLRSSMALTLLTNAFFKDPSATVASKPEETTP